MSSRLDSMNNNRYKRVCGSIDAFVDGSRWITTTIKKSSR